MKDDFLNTVDMLQKGQVPQIKTPQRTSMGFQRTEFGVEFRDTEKQKGLNMKELCEFAIPGKEFRKDYEFPYKCGVFYGCRFKEPLAEKAKFCPRYEIGKRQRFSNKTTV